MTQEGLRIGDATPLEARQFSKIPIGESGRNSGEEAVFLSEIVQNVRVGIVPVGTTLGKSTISLLNLPLQTVSALQSGVNVPASSSDSRLVLAVRRGTWGDYSGFTLNKGRAAPEEALTKQATPILYALSEWDLWVATPSIIASPALWQLNYKAKPTPSLKGLIDAVQAKAGLLNGDEQVGVVDGADAKRVTIAQILAPALITVWDNATVYPKNRRVIFVTGQTSDLFWASADIAAGESNPASNPKWVKLTGADSTSGGEGGATLSAVQIVALLSGLTDNSRLPASAISGLFLQTSADLLYRKLTVAIRGSDIADGSIPKGKLDAALQSLLDADNANIKIYAAGDVFSSGAIVFHNRRLWIKNTDTGNSEPSETAMATTPSTETLQVTVGSKTRDGVTSKGAFVDEGIGSVFPVTLNAARIITVSTGGGSLFIEVAGRRPQDYFESIEVNGVTYRTDAASGLVFGATNTNSSWLWTIQGAGHINGAADGSVAILPTQSEMQTREWLALDTGLTVLPAGGADGQYLRFGVNGAYWGAAAASDPNAIGIYQSGSTYAMNRVVLHSGVLYRSKVNNNAQTPGEEGSSNWEVTLDLSADASTTANPVIEKALPNYSITFKAVTVADSAANPHDFSAWQNVDSLTGLAGQHSVAAIMTAYLDAATTGGVRAWVDLRWAHAKADGTTDYYPFDSYIRAQFFATQRDVLSGEITLDLANADTLSLQMRGIVAGRTTDANLVPLTSAHDSTASIYNKLRYRKTGGKKGDPPPFASLLDVETGTDEGKAISAKVLRDYLDGVEDIPSFSVAQAQQKTPATNGATSTSKKFMTFAKVLGEGAIRIILDGDSGDRLAFLAQSLTDAKRVAMQVRCRINSSTTQIVTVSIQEFNAHGSDTDTIITEQTIGAVAVPAGVSDLITEKAIIEILGRTSDAGKNYKIAVSATAAFSIEHVSTDGADGLLVDDAVGLSDSNADAIYARVGLPTLGIDGLPAGVSSKTVIYLDKVGWQALKKNPRVLPRNQLSCLMGVLTGNYLAAGRQKVQQAGSIDKREKVAYFGFNKNSASGHTLLLLLRDGGVVNGSPNRQISLKLPTDAAYQTFTLIPHTSITYADENNQPLHAFIKTFTDDEWSALSLRLWGEATAFNLRLLDGTGEPINSFAEFVWSGANLDGMVAEMRRLPIAERLRIVTQMDFTPRIDRASEPVQVGAFAVDMATNELLIGKQGQAAIASNERNKAVFTFDVGQDNSGEGYHDYGATSGAGTKSGDGGETGNGYVNLLAFRQATVQENDPNNALNESAYIEVALNEAKLRALPGGEPTAIQIAYEDSAGMQRAYTLWNNHESDTPPVNRFFKWGAGSVGSPADEDFALPSGEVAVRFSYKNAEHPDWTSLDFNDAIAQAARPAEWRVVGGGWSENLLPSPITSASTIGNANVRTLTKTINNASEVLVITADTSGNRENSMVILAENLVIAASNYPTTYGAIGLTTGNSFSRVVFGFTGDGEIKVGNLFNRQIKAVHIKD